MPFQNDIVTGAGKLLVPSIRSPNYLPGISGWAINRDGTAEFASGTFRGPVVIQDPATGLALASIGINGNGSFTNLNVAGDIILGNTSLLDALVNTGGRVVGYWDTVGALPAPGNGVMSNTAYVNSLMYGDRLYKIEARPLRCNNSGASTSLDTQWVYKVTNRPGVTVTFGGTRQTVNPTETLYQRAFFADILANGTATFQMQSRGGSGNLTYQNVGGWGLIVYDLGPLSFIFGGLGGGAGAAGGVTQRTTLYPATASRSYDGNSNPIAPPDRDNNVYLGSFPDRPWGNERAIIIFDGAQIRSDLSGATIQDARLYLYCIKAEESNGTLNYSLGTNTSPPATLNPGLFSADFGYDDDWPVPGWNSVSMLDPSSNGTALAQIQGGDNAVIFHPTLFGLAATGFAGFGAGAGIRPYISITYTK